MKKKIVFYNLCSKEFLDYLKELNHKQKQQN